MTFHFSPSFPIPGVAGRKGWWVYVLWNKYPRFLGVVDKQFAGYYYTLHTEDHKDSWALGPCKSRGQAAEKLFQRWRQQQIIELSGLLFSGAGDELLDHLHAAIKHCRHLEEKTGVER